MFSLSLYRLTGLTPGRASSVSSSVNLNVAKVKGQTKLFCTEVSLSSSQIPDKSLHHPARAGCWTNLPRIAICPVGVRLKPGAEATADSSTCCLQAVEGEYLAISQGMAETECCKPKVTWPAAPGRQVKQRKDSERNSRLGARAERHPTPLAKAFSTSGAPSATENPFMSTQLQAANSPLVQRPDSPSFRHLLSARHTSGAVGAPKRRPRCKPCSGVLPPHKLGRTGRRRAGPGLPAQVRVRRLCGGCCC